MGKNHQKCQPKEGQGVHERRRLLPGQENLHKSSLPEHKRPGRHHRHSRVQGHRVRTDHRKRTELHFIRQAISNVQSRKAACDHFRDKGRGLGRRRAVHENFWKGELWEGQYQ